MSEFKEGDVVRVINQSKEWNAHIRTEGMVGFIEELQMCEGVKLALFHELELEGRPSGLGSIPLDCLEHAHIAEDAKWFRAKEKYYAYMEKLNKEHELYRMDLDKEKVLLDKVEKLAIETTATDMNIDSDHIRKILDFHEESRKMARKEFKVPLDDIEMRLRYHRKEY